MRKIISGELWSFLPVVIFCAFSLIIILGKKDDVSVDPNHRYDSKANIIVSKKRSYEAASVYKGQKVCVHNFASATTPGEGVVKGSSAQEECLCRTSTLYFCINTQDMWDGFYNPHRRDLDGFKEYDTSYRFKQKGRMDYRGVTR